MHCSKKLSTALLTTVAAAGLAAPGTASAVPNNPYGGGQICGPASQYWVLAQDFPLRSGDGKVELGRIQLWYSGPTGKSCGVVLKERSVGTATYTSLSMAKSSATPKWIGDGGYFSYYAGPRYIAATPACVRIGGYMKIPNGREGIFVEPSWAGCPF